MKKVLIFFIVSSILVAVQSADHLLDFLLNQNDRPARPIKHEYVQERQRYDGWFNNMAHPEWGSVESRLVRKSPASYADGVYMMSTGSDRPSPRKLSESFMKGRDGQGSSMNRTGLLAFFGQVVTAEILHGTKIGCPLEIHEIKIDECDEMFDKECGGKTRMPFYRAHYDRETGHSPNSPREQLNDMTSWIDGSFIYSCQETWANKMRSFKNGSLKWSNEDPILRMPPYNVDKVPLNNAPIPGVLRRTKLEEMLLLGDSRTNQNPAFLTLGILFYRWHNILAEKIQEKHPTWRDESVFQAARRVNVAMLQNIIAYEYLPAFLGDSLPPYKGYKPDVHPGISHDFQSAAFRFGHTMIPPGIYRRDGKCYFKKEQKERSPALRLCSTWWNAQGVLKNLPDSNTFMEDILRGLASQIAEKEDTVLCSDVRNKLFGPMQFSRRDLASLNIMRGRDTGMPDYNTVRESYGLSRILKWADINPYHFEQFPNIVEELEKVYGKDGIDKVDVYIGGMLETYNGPGPLFREIIKEQFGRIRDGDRFWFENTANGLFTKEEIAMIKNATLWDIIVNATDVLPDEIQKNVFFWKPGDPCEQPAQLNASDLPVCEHMKGYDSFQGSEMAYMYGIVLLLFIPLFCIGSAYGLIKVNNIKRKRARDNLPDPNCFGKVCVNGEDDDEDDNNNNNFDKSNDNQKENQPKKTVRERIRVREWMEPLRTRPVLIYLIPDATIRLVNRKRETLRNLNLGNNNTNQDKDQVINKSNRISVQVTRDTTDPKPMILVKIPHSHDMVLEFESESARKKFLLKLEQFVARTGKVIDIVPVYKRDMLNLAETKEKRNRKLEIFFREAYAITFGLNENAAKKKREFLETDTPDGDEDQQEVSRTEIKPHDVEVMTTALTPEEFANALGMRTNDHFVKKMFKIVDKDQDGKISFQEFLDTVVLFSTTTGKGADEKLRILFDMCDTNENGQIDKSELKEMLVSLIDIAKTVDVGDHQVHALIESLFKESGLEKKEFLSYDDFKAMMNEFDGDFLAMGLDCKGVKHNFLGESDNIARLHEIAASLGLDEDENPSRLETLRKNAVTYLEDNRQHIFYLIIFFSINIWLFVERFIQYAYYYEHRDLRHIMGMGISITRGSAAALSFDYSILLLTMSRNLLTMLKETTLHQYIPIDSSYEFHKICACTALFLSVVHSAGHVVNFYHIATQPLEHLSCFSPELSFSTENSVDISHWLFKTLTGLTGLALYTLMCIIFVFSLPLVRKMAYRFFWLVHQTYVLFYILALLHGLQRITAPSPTFWTFFIIPSAVFMIDKVISLRRSYFELDILETKILPSDVIKVTFYRPPNFTYRSGQWARVSVNLLGYSEYHSFTFTSSPHEDFLSIHVKARGPWTWRLRNYFDPNLAEVTPQSAEEMALNQQNTRMPGKASPINENDQNVILRKSSIINRLLVTSSAYNSSISRGRNRKSRKPLEDETQLPVVAGTNDINDAEDNLGRIASLSNEFHPKIRIQGPYGGGNQDWYKYEVAVMIGAGIGVTPYASILNDLVFGTSTNRFTEVACKKVYFIWITPSHRSFEWFMDVLRDVERKDVTNVLEMHIFITQFFHKYDLRTTMLYICENHFQRLSRRSLFTNLRAANHFGRPDMSAFLKFVQQKHSYVSEIGVFSCGPKAVIETNSLACQEVNRGRQLPYFSHHYEQVC